MVEKLIILSIIIFILVVLAFNRKLIGKGICHCLDMIIEILGWVD